MATDMTCYCYRVEIIYDVHTKIFENELYF